MSHETLDLLIVELKHDDIELCDINDYHVLTIAIK